MPLFSKKEKFIRICPKCGSLNKSPIDNLPAGTAFLGAVSQGGYFECLDCGYEGLFPEAKESEVKKIQEEIKNRK